MFTLYHSYWSRATRMLAFLHEADLRDRVDLVHVDISRNDGSGGPDARNPHPDHKVPALDHDGTIITETAAIMLYLADLFPESGLAPRISDKARGPFLTWLNWYSAQMEPAYVVMVSGVDHPVFHTTFRGVADVERRLIEAFADGRPFLLGDRFTAADLLIQSPYKWFADAVPDDANVKAWVERINARPSYGWAAEIDAKYAPQAA
ncbi:glutathione S-transferase family protein [Maritimibacter sp. DP1N21-5]|uniref:glutathione S-transferase family protein n=1 Tax=Maritimibacter sp. DP1N21-5 TaxID=2836867 RepID=UPI001C467574|nr:glutathione S-transferase family protein [Maritimibacter sp. DP1N21-5]MBV7410908.1 glutathione S-transferase family protein [Maritimibacter sp. DP1N21-5]